MNVGEVYMYGGSVAPAGFLLCDGSAVSRTTYSDLFEIIGTTFGQGDGSSTFNVPDLSGRVVIGVSSNILEGDTGGEETHVILSTELPVHSHEIPAHGHANTITATTPKFVHSITQPAFTYSAPSGNSKCMGSNGYGTSSSVNATRSANLAISNHTAAACTKTGSVTDCTAFDTASVGSNTAHDNMQPYVALNHIIYAGVGA